jgi:hypothetical protein
MLPPTTKTTKATKRGPRRVLSTKTQQRLLTSTFVLRYAHDTVADRQTKRMGRLLPPTEATTVHRKI